MFESRLMEAYIKEFDPNAEVQLTDSDDLHYVIYSGIRHYGDSDTERSLRALVNACVDAATSRFSDDLDAPARDNAAFEAMFAAQDKFPKWYVSALAALVLSGKVDINE